MNHFPERIKNYLAVNRLADSGYYYLKSKVDGFIEDTGTLNTCSHFNVNIGERIQGTIPELESFFPLATDNFLPQFNCPDGGLGKVHLMKNDNTVWIFIQKTEADYEIQPVDCEQVKQAKLQLQDLLKLKDQFVKIVSHDFRSPIATIIDGLTIVQANFRNQKEISNADLEIVDQVIDELLQLLNYTNKLYNWTQLDLSTDLSKWEEISFENLVSAIEMNYFVRLEQKNIQIVRNFDSSLKFFTDFNLFNLVIQHLIDNAIKFSPVNSKIVIDANLDRIKVTDCGGGVSSDKIDQITKGYLIKNKKLIGGGVGPGLGLNIVYRILKVLKYTMEIEANEQKGTCFTIKLS